MKNKGRDWGSMIAMIVRVGFVLRVKMKTKWDREVLRSARSCCLRRESPAECNIPVDVLWRSAFEQYELKLEM
jgi:hypothetical protein